MTDYSLTILVIEGTVRDGRRSIHPARYVTDRFQENGHDVELFDMKNYDIPLLKNQRHSTSDPHPDVNVVKSAVKHDTGSGNGVFLVEITNEGVAIHGHSDFEEVLEVAQRHARLR